MGSRSTPSPQYMPNKCYVNKTSTKRLTPNTPKTSTKRLTPNTPKTSTKRPTPNTPKTKSLGSSKGRCISTQLNYLYPKTPRPKEKTNLGLLVAADNPEGFRPPYALNGNNRPDPVY